MCLVVGEPSATLMIMSDNDRLAEYEASTREPLDLLALATLWLVVVPPGDFGHDVSGIVWTFRIALSVVYGIDIAIRSALAPRHVHYALAHPLALVSVILPPLRVIFSLRLVRSMFRRGHLSRFLVAAAVLVLNGAVIVYLFERHAPGANIHTLGDETGRHLRGDHSQCQQPGGHDETRGDPPLGSDREIVAVTDRGDRDK